MNKGLFEASEEGTPQGGPLRTDEWLRRRIRMCIWKAWKKVKTKVANLIRCGINKYQAYEWGNTRKVYWRIADIYIPTKNANGVTTCLQQPIGGFP